MPAVRWRGVALGAKASITLHHPEPARARRMLIQCAAEIRRLEAIFSLYRSESAICRLNREGRLARPPFELLDLISQAQAVSEASKGAFDLTVQPLFDLHAQHFASPNAAAQGPGEEAIAGARRLVDYLLIDASTRCIHFARPGMQITANGIAQGYITDRVAELLREEGARHVLVDLGELRAIGQKGNRHPWRIALEGGSVLLGEGALATSDPIGTVFGTRDQHHLLDPYTGRPASRARRVTVKAPSATLADALSTARAVADPALVARLDLAFPRALEVAVSRARRCI